MSEVEILPELKQIIGAMLFVAKQPLTKAEIRRVLVQVAEIRGGPTRGFAKATESDIQSALDQLKTDLTEKHIGLHVIEVANGYRLENDESCGPWLRHLLERRPTRLSRPALETLAIIAYRQPAVRSEIEKVRGVAVDQILRNLLDLQLIRIVGRSELPGRPWLFGTTQKFLEHFGLRNLEDLPGIEELKRMEAEQIRREKAGKVAADELGAAPDSEKGGPGEEAMGGEKAGETEAPAKETPEDEDLEDEDDLDEDEDDEDNDEDEEEEEKGPQS